MTNSDDEYKPGNKLLDLIVKVFHNQGAYLEAKTNAANARSLETQCLNMLNDSQRELDILLEGMRKQAPEGSDWNIHKKPPPFN